MQMDDNLIDWSVYTECRAALGPNFVRILGYFREDGTQSVAKIEGAMRTKNATEIVMPAHTLKGEAGQFGALRLAELAERIELIARKCIEHREAPDEIMELAAGLRPLFEKTLSALDKESSPVVQRKPPARFGRRASGFHQNLAKG